MNRHLNKLAVGIAALVVLGVSQSYAQQDPMFTNYLQNPTAFNPAVAGTIDGLNLSLLTRHQWIGVDGAPNSFSFGAHTPYIKQNMGLAFNVMTDKAGPLRMTHITGSYSYQITVVKGLKLSMGLKAGVSNYIAKVGGLLVNDPTDPQFQTDETRTSPNLGVGFYLYSKDYYAGISAPRLVEARLKKEQRDNQEPYSPQIYLMGGYKFPINRDWEIIPSSIIGIMIGQPPAVDITAQVDYLKRFSFGPHYRIGDAAGLFFNGKVNKDLTLGYAFDFSLNKLSKINSGTHEFMIRYTINGLW